MEVQLVVSGTGSMLATSAGSLKELPVRNHVDANRILQLNRQFHDEVESQSYDQRMGVRYGGEDVRRTLSELERVLGRALPSGGTVLDLGAGTGNLAVKLAMDGRFDRVVAVDISKGMLQEAEDSARRQGVSIETCVSDMLPLPFADQSVDLVVGCAMLHHVPDVAGLMTEVARVLKSGAPVVFIGEPSTWGAGLTATVKAPVVLAARVLNALCGRDAPRWDHDDIDVHTFSGKDVKRLTAAHFRDLRLCREGLLEPVIDQAVLAPALLALGHRPRVAGLARALRGGLSRADSWLKGRIPEGCFVSLKFSAERA